jgi:hypothetical protein
MSTVTTTTYTGNSAGNVHASASLGAGANTSDTVDSIFATCLMGFVHVKNTPGGSVAATRGLRIDVFRRYGSSPTTGETAWYSFTMPSTTASIAESLDFTLEPGKYSFKFTNLDASNAITVEATGDVLASLLTT